MSTAATSTGWPLASAEKVATRIRTELLDYCERIEIAGSIRRQRPHVGDLDLVLLTREGARPALEKRLQRNPDTRILRNGRENMALVLANGMQVDLFFATAAVNDLAGYVPGNFGMRLLAMTGSKEHNIFLTDEARKRGYHFHPYKGLMRGGYYAPLAAGGREYRSGEVFAAEEELTILKELGLGWVPPEQREIEGRARLADAGGTD
jgi:DNA polymerase (family X)